MRLKLPLVIPILFMTFIALGTASYKTLLVGTLFAMAFSYGIFKGEETPWKEKEFKVIKEEHLVWAFLISLLLIALQIFMIKKVPLLDSSARHLLNPHLTALTYFLGVPSSVYLFSKGKKYSLVYPFLVALYGYRTPVLVSFLAFAVAYFDGKDIELKHLAGFSLLILAGLVGIALARGEALGTQLVRVQATTSVLDVIIDRTPWHGFYHGYLQWTGIRSYLLGGYSPRVLVARFLHMTTGVSITPTLLGGMYLDFGVFSIIEGFLLGVYYGMISKAKSLLLKVIYYTTLAYGIVGVETGILDLPVYLFFFVGFYALIRGKYAVRVMKVEE
ncbi:hypothetical protein OCC_09801 [Thermococcus litoralis DSM 5473]|jgi:uncharacterized membrane protein|uniref:Oligosaccharide repeat unit polymerase n=1 Tax=Thermococcus litoralis (strain ATCC 51850 / DSM 5473 / JCM 8560 / NS-C) TaxID=523849 RepID=H3ZQY1_THELN|nr:MULTISPECIES: hypothetical protein [Thermococcus]EHR77707.1 hypothetical protein OCC_09801 [Thermococcus litoralis DSM 5473]MDK2783112.1 hypothetical protein [Thermococcaceae archaeon]MDN5320227.1 hypothetical protein [Thermococcaceae archaeon]